MTAITSLATRQQVMLERLKAGEVKKLATFLKQAADVIRRRLSQGELTDMERGRAELQLQTIRTELTAIYGEAGRTMTDGLKDYANYAASAETRALDAVVIQGVELAVPAANQIYAAAIARPMTSGKAATLLEPFISEWSSRSVTAIENTVRQGFFEGRTNQQIIKDIIGTKANGYQDGIIDVTRRSAETVVRTSIQHVAQVARNEVYSANADIVSRYEWVSTLDSRTTVQCFPAPTEVSAIGELENIFRANYSGEFIIITTASGKKLSGTPNHPVLTPSGFLPLHEINPDKQVICPVFDKRVMVLTDQDVSMPSPVGQLFDSFCKLPSLDIHREGAAAVDFYGDGRAMNGEVDIIRVNGKLRSDCVPGAGKQVKNESFGLVERAGSLSAYCGSALLFVRDRLPEMASEIDVFAIENGIDTAFAPSNNFTDFDWLDSFIEKLDNPQSVGLDIYINLASLKHWHDAMLFEKAGDGGSCNGVAPAYFSGGNSFSIELDNVISTASEFRDCHVYTLGTSLGMYIAEGIIVKNCQSLDGREFEIGKGPLPPLHPNCRSSTVPVINNKYIRETLRQGATRVSADGPVPANMSYYEWLKTQPVDFQNEAIGPVRAQLLRDGGLSAQRFQELQLGRNFEPLTLDEMKKLEPVAFNRAGL